MPAGRQVLALVAPTYFLRQNVTVDVRLPPAVAAVAAPALGKINIRANPDNCQVFIDGEFVETIRRSSTAPSPPASTAWLQRPDGARQRGVGPGGPRRAAPT